MTEVAECRRASREPLLSQRTAEVWLARDRVRREQNEVLGALRGRFEALTPRERTIMIQVTQGRLSKQIAGDMGITEATVKVHRSNIMRKMRVASTGELCRIADKLKLVPERPPTL